jgi:membrane fusion protein (multidrug efflux system)
MARNVEVEELEQQQGALGTHRVAHSEADPAAPAAHSTGSTAARGDGPPRTAPAPPPQGQAENQAPNRGTPRRFRLAAMAVVALLAVAAVLYWAHSRQYEDTDDAQVDGHIHPISPKINGTVLSVSPELEDNHEVSTGSILVTIDPTTYKAEVELAQAELWRLQASASASASQAKVSSANAVGQLRIAQAAVAEARSGVASEQAALSAARARVAQAEAVATRAEVDRIRYENLLRKQEISRSEFDQRSTEARTAAAALEVARAEMAAARNHVAQAESRVAVEEAGLLKARSAPQQIAASRDLSTSATAEAQRAAAQLKTASINLASTTISAPVSGIIEKRSVEKGQRVQQGQELFTIIDLKEVWVTANFKESQLRLMRPGQPVGVHVDAYGIDLPGHVESMAAATGARFSLLPPENASGNFVKVVQRLPVRIRFDHQQDPRRPLRPGMSVIARVRVR